MKQVFFAKDEFFGDANFSTFKGKEHLPMRCYQEITSFAENIGEDEIYFRTQSIDESWSPSCFRSMSVGDLIRDTETGKTIICCGVGWEDYTGNK